jgi:hypothetical protein
MKPHAAVTKKHDGDAQRDEDEEEEEEEEEGREGRAGGGGGGGEEMGTKPAVDFLEPNGQCHGPQPHQQVLVPSVPQVREDVVHSKWPLSADPWWCGVVIIGSKR